MIQDPNDILKEQSKFYENLYDEKLDHTSYQYTQSLDYFLNSDNNPSLSDEEKIFCDSEITIEEVLSSLKELKNNKTPGTDGLTAEFYKFFWIDIKEILVDSFKNALRLGILSIEQRRGVITLIPKKNKNRLFLKNWRPISLLNIDYKILAKLFAHRMKKVIDKLIHEDQSGYIKGRFIGQNIRLIEDLSFFTERNNLPGIILNVDFEKAFDSLNWNFIDKALQKFNFGPNFRKWIQTLYCNIESTIINNGHTSPYFKIKRGIRQGCPLSAYLFLIAVEILAIKIRSDDKIKGIKINDAEVKLSQLADDMSCFMEDLESLQHSLQTFKLFSYCSGLKVNYGKTTAKYIGSLKNSDFYPHGLSWIKHSIETLGIRCTNNTKESYNHNFKPRILTLKNTLNIWSQRSLSLKGKITVVNNLALSPLIYVSSIIDTPKDAIVEIKKCIDKFLWNGKKAKIARSVIEQSTESGGLKLCNFEIKVQALKLSWVNRLISSNNANWTQVAKFYYKTNDLNLYFRTKQNQINTNNEAPVFYKDIHNLWMKMYSSQPSTAEEVQNEVLWKNKFITSNSKCLNWKEWRNNGIIHVSDLLDNNGMFYDHIQLQNIYGIKCNFLDVLQLRQNLPRKWKELLVVAKKKIPKNNDISINICGHKKTIFKCRCKDYYWNLLNASTREPTCIKSWTKIFPILADFGKDQWGSIFKIPFQSIRETNIQSFQYKLNNRIIPCNEWLCTLKVKDNDCCNYCNCSDTLLHFFIWCEKCKHFWVRFFNWWNSLSPLKSDTDLKQLEAVILFGIPPRNNDILKVLDFCLLIAKFYIYRQKLFNENNIEFYDFLVLLKYKIKIEELICKKENRPDKFERFFFIYENL